MHKFLNQKNILDSFISHVIDSCEWIKVGVEVFAYNKIMHKFSFSVKVFWQTDET